MIYVLGILLVAVLVWQGMKNKCKCEKCDETNCKCDENNCGEHCKCHDEPEAQQYDLKKFDEPSAPAPYLNGHSKKITAVIIEEEIEEPKEEPKAPEPIKEEPKKEDPKPVKKPAPKKVAPKKVDPKKKKKK